MMWQQLLESQRRAWGENAPVAIEELVSKHPQATSSPDGILDLIYQEVVLREQAGEAPQLGDYIDRFPSLAAELTAMFDLEDAFANELAGEMLSGIDEQGNLPRDEDTNARNDTTLDHVRKDHHGDESPDVDGGKPSAPPAGQSDDGLAKDTLSLPGSVRAVRRSQNSETQQFGDYELLSEIASGGMGVVWKARQKKANRIVALKMILSGQLAGQEEVDRFYAEAESVAKLDHPNIVPLYDVGQIGGRHYFSMAYVDGENLAETVREQPLEPQHAAELTVQIARAVDYAHQNKIIHRDLKPANILLEPNGTPRITDFGLAKRVEGNSGLTMSGHVLGTPSYMPPEQAMGENDRVGPAADVYAMGAVLYHLLTGRPPFGAANVAETLQQVIGREPVPVRVLNPSIDRDLETICLKCLEKSPDHRYDSAAEFGDDLDRYLQGAPVAARPVSRLNRGARWCRRNPTLAGLFAATALSLILGTATSTYFAIEADKRANEADAEAAKAKTSQAAAEASARSEERAKREALVTLSSSFNNLGFVEADQGKYAEAQLWFAKAAEMTTDDELKAVYTMRARAFGREGIQPLQMFYGRPPRTQSKVSTEHQLAMDPSNRYLRYRLLFHGAPDDTQDPLQDEYVLLDLYEEREVEFAGQEKLWAVDFAPQGKEMAVAFASGIVRLLQVADLSVSHEIQLESEGPITLLQYSDDGRRLFIGSNPARVLDVANRKLLAGDMPLPTPARRAAFTADNQVICSTHVLNGISYNQFTQTYLFPLGVADAQPLEKGMREAVAATRLDADENRKIAVLNSQAVIDRYQLDLQMPGQSVRKISPLPMSLGRACVSHDGSRIAFIGGIEGLVACYELNLPADWTLSAATGEDLRPVWTRDSQFVAAVGRGAAEIVVHSHRGQPISQAIRPAIPIQDAAFSPDGELLVLACGDVTVPKESRQGELQFWDWRRGEQVADAIVSKYVPQSIVYHPTENWLAIAMPLSNRIFKLAAGGERKPAADRDIQLLTLAPTSEPDDFDRILFSGDGRWLLNRGKKNVWSVGYLNLASKKYDAMALTGGSTSVTISAAGDLLMVVCYGDPHVNCPWVFDMVSQQPLQEQPFPMINVYPRGHLSADGKRALFYGEGSNLAIYHLQPEPELACPIIKPLAQNGRIMAEFVHGTPYIAAATWLNNRSEVLIYEPLTGQRIGPRRALRMDVTSPLWVSPDGRAMAVRSEKAAMRFIDLAYLHEEPRDGMSESEFVEYAKVQACADFEGARLISANAVEIWKRLQLQRASRSNAE